MLEPVFSWRADFLDCQAWIIASPNFGGYAADSSSNFGMPHTLRRPPAFRVLTKVRCPAWQSQTARSWPTQGPLHMNLNFFENRCPTGAVENLQ